MKTYTVCLYDWNGLLKLQSQSSLNILKNYPRLNHIVSFHRYKLIFLLWAFNQEYTCQLVILKLKYLIPIEP